MPSIDVALPPPPPGPIEKEEQPPTASQPIVGIIYPPPEVRNIVDKTASFVARNGPEFESRIRQNELNNPKFNFLNTGDPYNAYYQHKVKEIRDGKVNEAGAGAVVPVKSVATSTQQKQQELLKQMEQVFVPKDPPPDFEFMADPPSISALDLDIVKLTAQFVARNGRQFLTNLMNREQRNYQFDFLRPQHSLFQYFTKLLEQYTKILIPPKDLMSKLKEEGASAHTVLDHVKYRSDWIRHQEAQKRKEEMALEKERVAYSQIDWHDFVVVETVDYMPGEIGNFPPPTTPDEVGARVLMQERGGAADNDKAEEEDDDDEEEAEESDGEAMESEPEEEPSHVPKLSLPDKPAIDDNQVQDMEEESSSSEDDLDDEKSGQPPVPGVSKSLSLPPPPPGSTPAQEKKTMQPPLPPAPDKVIIKKDYNPKSDGKAAPKSDDYLISPINGERIPASKVQEHMKICLLDPRWVEQRDKNIQDRINQENVYAPGSAIEASLKQLAERRTDIFGIGDEETAIGKKIGEEDKKKDDKVTWDGYTSSVEAATRAARANITIEEQIHQIHKVKGLLPDEEKEKIGPKPVQGKQMPPVPPSKPAPPPPPPPTPSLPPLPPSKPPQPPLPPPSLPPPPGIIPPPQPPIMMVPAPIRPPLMVPGPFPVVTPGAPFMGPPGTRPVPPPPPPQPPQMGLGIKPPPPEEDEPPAKKAKTEESLIPEAEFLANNKSPVSFKILVPNMAEKSDWRLNGQVITLSLPLEDAVSTLKAKVQEATGMPPAKQKLHLDGLFFKDSNTLAYYNINNGVSITLGVKERGGRRK